MNVKFPIGELVVPENVTLQNVEEWLAEISSYADRLAATVNNLDDEDLKKTYRKDSWNIRQLVHHIADSQIVMYQRLKLALTDDTPTVPNFIQDEWAILADTELPVESSLKLLEGINERIVALGKTLSIEQLKRSFIHEINGEITVATKIAKLAWHEEHHLAHIKIALKN